MSTGTHRNGGAGSSRRGLWIGLGALVAVLLVAGLVVGLGLVAGGSSTPVTAGGATTATAATSAPAGGTAPASSMPANGTAPASATTGNGTAPASSSAPSAAGGSTPVGGNSPSPAASGTGPSAAASSHAVAPVAPRGTGVGTEQPTLAPAAKIGQSATVTRDVSVRVTGIEAVQGVAEGVGERSGPAVRVTFELKNSTGTPVSTASAVANVEYGPDRVPADELRGRRAAGFAASIAPGATATASYTYLVPTDQRGDLRITFFFDPTVPAAQFTGSAT